MKPIDDVIQMSEVISEEELKDHLERIYGEIRHSCKMYRDGLCTKDELCRLVSISLNTGFYDFLDRNEPNREYRIQVPIRRNFTPDSWVRFCEDHERWKRGEQPVSTAGCQYLYYDYDYPKLGIKAGDEASVLDKIHFLQLMDAFLMPKEYFEPIPGGCPTPKYHRFHSGTVEHFSSIEFACTDDAGLLSDALSAVGKKYVLTDVNGLKAELEIQDIIKEGRMIGKPALGFKAFGIIEGYTSLRRREIEVAIYMNTSDIFLFSRISEDDIKAFDEHPLWTEYHNYSRNKADIYNGIIDSIINKTMGEL